MSDIFGGPPDDEEPDPYDIFGYPEDYGDVQGAGISGLGRPDVDWWQGQEPDPWWYDEITIYAEDGTGREWNMSVQEAYDLTLPEHWDDLQEDYGVTPIELILQLEDMELWTDEDWETWRDEISP